MLRSKTCCLVPMWMILGFSTVLAGDSPQERFSLALDSFESFRVSATVGQAFFGPLGNNVQAVTSLQVTNIALQECEVGILVHKGVSIPSQFPVLINGEPGLFTSETIRSGGVTRFDLTAPEFIQGAVALGFRTLAPGCDANSFKVTATSFVTDDSPIDETARIQGVDELPGDLIEAFSIAVHGAGTWLRSGFCRAISTHEGAATGSVRQRLAMAVSSAVPGQAAPEGSQLRFFAYGAQGNRIAGGATDVDGSHTAFFPRGRVLEYPEGGLNLIICLATPDPDYKMDLTVIGVNQKGDGTVQFSQLSFTDGFESGDVTAWGIFD